jgi:hypothetical protein
MEILFGLRKPPPRLDALWDNPTNPVDLYGSPDGQPAPISTRRFSRRFPSVFQSAPTTELMPPHRSRTSSFKTSHSSTDFAIRLCKPRPTQGPAVFLSRIETHVHLEVELPSGSWDSIQLPFTKSVTSDHSSSIGERTKPLLLEIAVRGATTRQEYSRVCEQCEKRMGNKKGSSGLIDFHSPSNILTSNGGMVQLHFTFSCYSRHHQKVDEQYMYVAVAQ